MEPDSKVVSVFIGEGCDGKLERYDSYNYKIYVEPWLFSSESYSEKDSMKMALATDEYGPMYKELNVEEVHQRWADWIEQKKR